VKTITDRLAAALISIKKISIKKIKTR